MIPVPAPPDRLPFSSCAKGALMRMQTPAIPAITITVMGLAAMDGAWYTGLAYSALICQSELGALMFETGGDVVMIGLDGHELWRWGADEIPLPNLTPQAVYWGDASASGPYLNYVEHWDDEGQPSYLYVDLRTGQVLDSEPSDYPADLLYQDGMGYFNGGWYKQADRHPHHPHRRWSGLFLCSARGL